MVKEEFIAFVDIPALEAHGEAEVVDFSHLSFVKSEAVQPLKEFFSCRCGLIKQTLKLLRLPPVLLLPWRIEDGFVHPGTDGKTRQIKGILQRPRPRRKPEGSSRTDARGMTTPSRPAASEEFRSAEVIDESSMKRKRWFK